MYIRTTAVTKHASLIRGLNDSTMRKDGPHRGHSRLPDEIRGVLSAPHPKNRIAAWKPENCFSALCTSRRRSLEEDFGRPATGTLGIVLPGLSIDKDFGFLGAEQIQGES